MTRNNTTYTTTRTHAAIRLLLLLLLLTVGVSEAWGYGYTESHTWASGEENLSYQVYSDAPNFVVTQNGGFSGGTPTSWQWDATYNGLKSGGGDRLALGTPVNSGQAYIAFTPYITGLLSVTFTVPNANVGSGAFVVLADGTGYASATTNTAEEKTLTFGVKAGTTYYMGTTNATNNVIFKGFSLTTRENWEYFFTQLGSSLTTDGNVSIKDSGNYNTSCNKGTGSFGGLAFQDFTISSNGLAVNGSGDRLLAILSMHKNDIANIIVHNSSTYNYGPNMGQDVASQAINSADGGDGTQRWRQYRMTAGIWQELDSYLALDIARGATVKSIQVISFYFNEDACSVMKGQTITPSFTNSATPARTQSFTSSNTDIATVDGNGTITGVNTGTATITASSDDGYTSSISVTVTKSFGWSSNDAVTVSLLDLDNNNHVNSHLPTLINYYNHSATYSPSTNDGAAWFAQESWETPWGSNLYNWPRVIRAGSVNITATDNTTNEFDTYTLNVTDPGIVTGTYDATSNTYSFNTVGRLAAGATISDVTGIGMQYGASGELPLVVSSGGKTVIKMIDSNGFSHPYIYSVNPIAGTFYKFTTIIGGVLTINGVFNNAKLKKADIGSEVTLTPSGDDMVATLEAGSTYYLYNLNSNVPMLHSFRYEPVADVIVGTSQTLFRNNDFAKQIGDNGSGFNYTSSNTAVLALEHGASTGILSIKGIGYATITETTTGRSFVVKVKKDDWDFGSIGDVSKNFGTVWGTWTEIGTITQSLEFKGLWEDRNQTTLQMNPGTFMKIPVIGSQRVELRQSNYKTFNMPTTNMTDATIRITSGSGTKIAGSTALPDATYTTIENNSSDALVYISELNTYFPQNTISFDNATCSVSYLPSVPQTGQTATTANTKYNVYYESQDISKATVDPWTGRVTTLVENTDVTIRAYNLGVIGQLNGGNYADYTLHIGSAEEFHLGFDVSDLLYQPGKFATANGLDRTIPGLTIIGQNDGSTMSRGTDGIALLYKDATPGQIALNPRYTEVEKVMLNSITVTFKEAPVAGEKITFNNVDVVLTNGLVQTFNLSSILGAAPNNLTIAYGSKADGICISKISLDGEANTGIAVKDIIDYTKSAPAYSYGYVSSLKIATGHTIDIPQPSAGSGFSNFRGTEYALSGTGIGSFTLDTNTMKLTANSSTGEGESATLTASFSGSSLFNASSSNASFTLTSETSSNQAAVNVKDKLDTYSLPEQIDAFVYTNGSNLRLTPTIDGADPVGTYIVRYTSSDPDILTITEDGNMSKSYGLFDTQNRQGLVTITANFIPISATNPILSATTKVYVHSGEWDFRAYDYDLYNSPSQWTSEWGTGQVRSRTRDTEDFEGVFNASNYPTDLAMALQTAHYLRFQCDGSDNTGRLQLFGYDKSYVSGQGGALRVPVREGMAVQLELWSDSENSEMDVTGLNDPNTGEPLEHIYVDSKASQGVQVFHFIAGNQGYFTISNPSANLNLYIQTVGVSNRIIFRYGNSTYVNSNAGSTFVNKIVNYAGSTFEYHLTNTTNAPAVTPHNTATDVVSLSAGIYGRFEMSATGIGGDHDGKTATYIATVIGFQVSDQTPSVAEIASPLDLRNALTISLGDLTSKLGLTEAAIKDEVTFTIDRTKTNTTTASVDEHFLTIDKVGEVNLIATLGGIQQEFKYTVQGGELHEKNPVIVNDKVSYTITIDGANASGHIFDIDRMKAGIMGELHGSVSSLKFYTGTTVNEDNRIADDATSVPASSITIAGFNNIQKGGAIPIFASYQYGSPAVTYYIEDVLTVAYTKFKWNFEHNLITGDPTNGETWNTNTGLKNWYKEVITESPYSISAPNRVREGKWTTTATFDMPTDYDDNEFIGDGVGKVVLATAHHTAHDWKFVRKVGETHRESSIVYYYNHTVTGTNALVIPETQGLLLNTSKNGQQLGVEMSSERVARAGNQYSNGWGKPVVYDPNTKEPIVEAPTYRTKDPVVWKDLGEGRFAKELEPVNEAQWIFGDDGAVSHHDQFLSGNTDAFYNCSNLMIKRGGQIIIPKVKPGQWIEVRWTRHVDDQAERLTMRNLCDVDGKYISEVYKIGNCYYNIPGNTSTYMFQVAKENTSRGDGTQVTLDDDGCVEGGAMFEIADNIHISIQQIELHELGWDYHTAINAQLKRIVWNGTYKQSTYVRTNAADPNKLYQGSPLYDSDGNAIYEKDSNNELVKVMVGTGLPENSVPRHYITSIDADTPATTFTLSDRSLQNAPNAPATWACASDATLTGFVFDASNYDAPTITYKGGWGKAVITLTSHSFEKNGKPFKYTANRKTWILTFGLPPTQAYPYTWDFTKYFDSTKTDAPATKVFQDYNHEVNSPDESFKFNQTLQTWIVDGDDVKTKDVDKYDTNVYTSYFVDGAQLVSTGINSGILPETAGLGFSISNKATGGLTLDMQNTVGTEGARASSGETWRSGELTITGGGTIIVPKPGSGFANFYVYVRANSEPSVNGSILQKQTDDVSDVGAEKQYRYRYHFLQNADAVLTFSGNAVVYSIGVTDIIKPLTTVGTKERWATESRNRTIDYTLTGYLTTNGPQTYVVEDATNASNTPAQNHRTTVKMGNEQKRYVVPHTPSAPIGLVMRQTAGVTADYSVPLFVPAVTTATDELSTFSDNLMMANLHERLLSSERENGTVDTNGDNVDDSGNDNGDYTRFILAKRYMEWKKNGTVINPTGFESQEAAVFYRLHLYGSADGLTEADHSTPLTSVAADNTADKLNTLGANKAYLLLPTSTLPAPLWNANSPSRPYIAILGVSDMEEDFDGERADGLTPSETTYNLRGQAVDDHGALPPGIYIRNGKKIIIK